MFLLGNIVNIQCTFSKIFWAKGFMFLQKHIKSFVKFLFGGNGKYK